MSTVAPKRAVAGFDSATALLRAVSLALRGKRFEVLGQGRLAAVPLRLSRLLPEGLRTQLYRISGAAEGVTPEMLASIDMQQVAAWMVGHYGEWPPQYPAAVIGSSNGAMAHLCAAGGIPWLPQTMLVPVRWAGNDPDRPARAADFGAAAAQPLLANNPDVVLHHMHDGNQDRLMIDLMTYFRLKWRQLPRAYEEFLATRVMPGGPIIVVDCGLSWPVTRIGDRHVFQTGAYGGLRPDEYLGGSPRVAEFLAAQGSPLSAFDAPAADSHAPEAEWGFAPALGDSIDRWAAAHGHPVYRIRFPDPHGLSATVADMHRGWLRAADRPARRLLVESFVLVDPVGVNEGGIVPFWTAFPVRDALRAVTEYLQDRHYTDVDVLLFPHGVNSAGIAGPDDWLGLREYGRSVRLPATDTARYPADFAALATYSSAIPTGDRQLRVSVRKILEQLGHARTA
ncbi:hypothetical protein [Kutzneria buriramensis]|uniref:Uncharacterized protein n=1 Tax=Kutzneria buriramensis TaxID=1045776 RepID=A0A3E0H7A0_9PSEU|nr:hypothetical protein [Kutzneria buriramensis]REH39319.1 hypothetical protein BCF44_113174 [Kutzneria buriramensis]